MGRGNGKIMLCMGCLSCVHIEYRKNYVYPWRCLLERGERFSSAELERRMNEGPCERYERKELE